MRKTVIWVEKLGLFEISIFLMLGTVCNLSIRYDERSLSRLARLSLNIFNKWNIGCFFYPINLSLEKRTCLGSSLAYIVDDNLRTCLSGFSKKYLFNEPDELRKMAECYLSGLLRKRVSFITCVEEELSNQKELEGRRILLLTKNQANMVISNFYSQRGFLVKESVGLTENIKNLMRPIYYIGLFIRSWLVPIKVRSSISHIRASIWIEYDEGIDSFVDTSFWRKHIDARDYDITFYLDRGDTSCNDETIRRIGNKGYKWIDMHHPILMVSSGDWSLSDLGKIIKDSFSKPGPLWLRSFWLQCYVKAMAYCLIFKSFKVKMIIQNQDTSWMQDMQRQAIENAGGIMMGFHWSNYPCTMAPSHLFPHHVFFVWGKIIHDVLAKGGNSCDYIIPCGLWISSDGKDIDRLKELSSKMKFTISIFDSSAAYDIHLTPSSLSQFYLRIFAILERNCTWGAVIKSKNRDMEGLLSLPNGQEIIHRLESLLNNGRACVIDSSVSPVTIAEYTDLSVCFGLNSAGIVVGTHGFRAIHWDCSGWSAHPFYRDLEQKIIYRTLDEFEQAILQSGEGDSSVGDFSKWRQEFNYYTDEEAGLRLGKFVNDYMQMVIKTNDHKRSLENAVNKFLLENDVKEDFGIEGDHWNG